MPYWIVRREDRLVEVAEKAVEQLRRISKSLAEIARDLKPAEKSAVTVIVRIGPPRTKT